MQLQHTWRSHLEILGGDTHFKYRLHRKGTRCVNEDYILFWKFYLNSWEASINEEKIKNILESYAQQHLPKQFVLINN